MISVTEDDGVRDLEEYLYQNAKPTTEWDYSGNARTDLSDLDRAEEFIREKIFCRTNQEIPYLVSQVCPPIQRYCCIE
jgi:GTPase Era involved in 16S rRNA processing